MADDVLLVLEAVVVGADTGRDALVVVGVVALVRTGDDALGVDTAVVGDATGPVTFPLAATGAPVAIGVATAGAAAVGVGTVVVGADVVGVAAVVGVAGTAPSIKVQVSGQPNITIQSQGNGKDINSSPG
jgi:hypothetical protein